jgi:outer membrane protein assembly factor BamB
MWSSTRRALAVVLGVGLLALVTLGGDAIGQIAVKVRGPVIIGPGGGPVPPDEQPADDPSGNHAIQLPTDSRARGMVEAGRDYVKDKDWERAVRVLQQLLDRKEDVFVELTRNRPDGKETTDWVSAKTEANRLIGTMDAEGLDYYRTRIGPQAKADLKEALEKNDKELLGQVSLRYMHTDAGAEALNHLATHELDRGDYTIASLRFARLMGRDGPDKLPPLTLFKASLAFHAAGDKENLAVSLKALENKASGDGIKMGTGNTSIALSEAKEYLNKFEKHVASGDTNDWPMRGGKNTRNGTGTGSTPFMVSRWNLPMYHGAKDSGPANTVNNWLFNSGTGAVRILENLNQPVLPAASPIAVTVRGDKVAKSMMLYRNYWGINAVDIKTGKLLWWNSSEWSLESMAEGSGAKANRLNVLNQWLQYYVQQNAKPSIVFENSTIGTLSSDGTRVYMVDDLAVPPPFMPNLGWQPQPNQRFGKDIDDATQHSRMRAFDLETGKEIWNIGGRGDEKENKKPGGELNDCYFLGPPLPLGGKLYGMIDKNQELRLVCLDAAKGTLVWSQALANTREKMSQDVNRRTQAVELAYGDGILVCPTNSGAVLGVDLLSHSLLWAHPYRDRSKEDQGPKNPWGGPGIGWGPGMGPSPLANDWKVTPPVIVDGKVVFTAPDANAVHCIDLRKGTALWTETKGQDDLYLAGVYSGKVLIIGKASARALHLSGDQAGKKAWERETGMPSGVGVASKDVYYLPLKGTVAEKNKPEICALNIETGAMVHTKSRPKAGTQTFEVPGNLVMYEGDLLSQGLSEITAFPQLDVQKKVAADLLAKNKNDPIGLSMRGELYLDEGKLIEAVTDLRSALDNLPDKSGKDKDAADHANLKLYDSLTELMAPTTFKQAEPYLDLYEKLCKFEVTEKDPKKEAEARAERERRTINFYSLLAKGREANKEYTKAFEAYMDFTALTANKKDELISTSDQANVRAAPDVWAQGRIAALVKEAEGGDKKTLDDLINKRWDEAKTKGDLLSFRQFVAMFGSQFAVGREARLQLAERLMEEAGTASLLDAERHLALLQGQTDDPTMAARAVETYARLLTRKGMLAEAVYYYKILGREYADVVIREGKKGAQFAGELAEDKRFLPYLDGPRFVLSGKVQVKAEAGNFPQNVQPSFLFETDNEMTPYFEQHKLTYSLQFQQFKLHDRATGEERWSPRLNNTQWFQNFLWNGGNNNKKRFPYQHVGHLVVLNMGNMVYGLDPVNKQVLWEKNLVGGQGIPPNAQLWCDPTDDSIQIMYPNNFRETIGHVGPADGGYVTLVTRDGLISIDPISGRTLWTRSGIGARSHLFGDAEHIYVTEINAEGQQGKAYALRASDGFKLDKVPEFSELYAKRLQLLGRTLLLADGGGEKAALAIRLYDIPTGKDVWKKDFPAGSRAVRSEEPGLAGAVEADGKVTILDTRAKKEVFEAKVDPRFLKDVNGIDLLSDSRHYYVFLNRPIDQNANPGAMSWPNIQPQTGMRCTAVNGEIYAFDKITRKVDWHDEVEQNMLLVDHFKDLPVVLFTARNNRPNLKGGGWGGQDVSITCIDKSNGKRLYDKTDLGQEVQQFYALNVDMKNGRVELIGWNFKFTQTIVPEGGAAPPDGGKKEPTPQPPKTGGGAGGGPVPLPPGAKP